MPLENRREFILTLATSADRLGYDGFFLPETWSWDITVVLGEIAARTQRITIGTSSLGIWGRTSATIAMAAATLAAASGGRFVLESVRARQPAEGLRRAVRRPSVGFSGPSTRCGAPQRRAHPLVVTAAATACSTSRPFPGSHLSAALGASSTRLAGEVRATGGCPSSIPSRVSTSASPSCARGRRALGTPRVCTRSCRRSRQPSLRTARPPDRERRGWWRSTSRTWARFIATR